MDKTIRVSEETHKELMKISGELTAGSGESYSQDETLRILIKKWRGKR